MTSSSSTPIVELQHISKVFGGERALDDVSLSVHPGEIHGLLGENGSGKSTLIKVLAGYHAPEKGGQLTVGGREQRLPLRAGEFRRLGMSFVHQDLGLIREVSAVENLWVGELSSGYYPWRIPWQRLRRRAYEAFSRLGVEIDPGTLVSELSPTDRALLAIVRAVEEIRGPSARHDYAERGEGLIVLDEPTVWLPRAGAELLYGVMREVVSQGLSVLFVSHDLGEVLEVTDRTTVLRNGKNEGTVVTRDTSNNELVDLILGRQLTPSDFAAVDRTGASIVASVRELSGGLLHGVTLDCHEREVVGLTGLPGSGFEEVLYQVYGARPATSGTVQLKDAALGVNGMTVPAAVGAGIALLPADRLEHGSVPSLTIGENVMLQVLDEYVSFYGMRLSDLRKSAAELLEDFDVRPPEPDNTYESLSGGNQQKALVAKWLQTQPELLLLHEPTQGTDIGARQQIVQMLRDAAQGGTVAICASRDHELLADLCDRVLILSDGRVTDEISGDAVSTDMITERVFASSNSSSSSEVATFASTQRAGETLEQDRR